MRCEECGQELPDGICEDCAKNLSATDSPDQAAASQAVEEDNSAENLDHAHSGENETAQPLSDSSDLDTDKQSSALEGQSETVTYPSSFDSEEERVGGGLKRIAVVFLLAAIIFGAYFLTQEGTVQESQPSEVYSSSEEISSQEVGSSSVTEPFSAEVQQEAQPAVELPSTPAIASGYIRAGSRQVAVQDVVSIYFPLTEKLEIGFYSQKVSDEDRKKSFFSSSLGDPSLVRPALLISASLVRGTNLCKIVSVRSLSARMDESQLGLGYEKDYGRELGGISDFNCQLNNSGQSGGAGESGQISVGFAQSGVVRTDKGTSEVRWEVRGNGPAYVSKIQASYAYSSGNRKPVVLLDKTKNLLEVGYFAKPLKEDDYKKIREQKSLLVLDNNSPLVAATFEFKEGFGLFQPESIKGYGIHFFYNPEADIVFPGDKDRVSFYYVMTTKQSEEIEGLSGHLHEGEQLRGSMKHAELKEFSGRKYKFEWDLRLAGIVMDLASEPLSSFTFEEPSSVSTEPPKANQGRIQVGKVTAELVDAVALYYPAENDIAVGFYQEKLTQADREQIFSNQSLWSQVGGKLPGLVVFFNLKPGVSALTRENILNYRLVFVRDKLGQFYFPGPTDRATIKKLAEEVTPTEVPYLGGNAREGKTIAFSLRGSYISKSSQLAFEWNVEGALGVKIIQ